MTCLNPAAVVITQSGVLPHKLDVKIYVDNQQQVRVVLSQIAPDQILQALQLHCAPAFLQTLQQRFLDTSLEMGHCSQEDIDNINKKRRDRGLMKLILKLHASTKYPSGKTGRAPNGTARSNRTNRC